MIQNGATLDSSALFASIHFKLPKIVETLLATGMDPNLRRPHKSKDGGSKASGVSALEEYSLWVAATQHGIAADTATDSKRKAGDTSEKKITMIPLSFRQTNWTRSLNSKRVQSYTTFWRMGS
ncbi:uncharacterized protein CC84DRAFT_1164833 [Paraphaeosphaeria sporulosa]|uniref:Ankyrin n=1 Tax=Paraphaeosphaeria sporulosa TaxID=1460663 RepID=A0A177CAX5_9PLEO|nr:uncharacterized protein CC84DRAFT_1164833 [Paraphaeosphaeria sporulosa]OAG04331.1 hypothetical protein CC84DRAFT_1164833 [Paraphaeosphaeria sporulosa]